MSDTFWIVLQLLYYRNNDEGLKFFTLVKEGKQLKNPACHKGHRFNVLTSVTHFINMETDKTVWLFVLDQLDTLMVYKDFSLTQPSESNFNHFDPIYTRLP
jgi:hypothetical protein